MRHATVLTASARRALVFTEIESAAGGGGGWVTLELPADKRRALGL